MAPDLGRYLNLNLIEIFLVVFLPYMCKEVETCKYP